MAILTDDDNNVSPKQQARTKRLNVGRSGVHCVMAFQCETCWIRNLTERDMALPRDNALRMCIRRANLDAFAGRSKSTIDSHVRGVRNSIKLSVDLGKPPMISQTPRGPMILGDVVGMSLAVEMLHYSMTAKGRIQWYVQFDTMRKLRSTYSRSWDSSPQGVTEGASFSKGPGKVRITSCPSQSQWLTDFLLGAQDRMGYDTKRQQAVAIKVVVLMLTMVKDDAIGHDDEYATVLYKFGALVAILTAASLRGYEGFYLDLAATRSHLAEGQVGEVPKKFKVKNVLSEEEMEKLPSVCICLMGKFKGETGERYHSMVLANRSMSGLETRWWVEQLMKVCEDEGRMSGFAFDEADGSPANSTEYNALFRQYLCRIQGDHPDVFSPKEEVTLYGISRTLRRSAVTRAGRAGLTEDVLNSVNRWNTVEHARGSRPRHNMRAHYTDARALAPMTWRYSYAL